MLVLTRKTNQSLTIGDNIRVTILSVDSDRISIGITAPKDIKIFRSELIEDTEKFNKDAGRSVFFSPEAMKKKPK